MTQEQIHYHKKGDGYIEVKQYSEKSGHRYFLHIWHPFLWNGIYHAITGEKEKGYNNQLTEILHKIDKWAVDKGCSEADIWVKMT